MLTRHVRCSRLSRVCARLPRGRFFDSLEPRLLLSGAAPVVMAYSRIFNINTSIDLGSRDPVWEAASLAHSGGAIASDFFGGYSDAEGDPLVGITLTGSPRGTITLTEEGETVAVTSGRFIPASLIPTLRYTPPAGWTGFEWLYWSAFDGTSFSKAKPATLSAALPDAVDTRKTTMADQPIDFETADLSPTYRFAAIVLCRLPAHGELSLVTGDTSRPVSENDYIAYDQLNQLRYTPAPGFAGTDKVRFQGWTGDALSTTIATITLTVLPVNDPPPLPPPPPVAPPPDNHAPFVWEAFLGKVETTGTLRDLNFHGAYRDADGDALAAIRLEAPESGTIFLTLEKDTLPVASGQVIPADQLAGLFYVPDPAARGTVSVSWWASDGKDFSSTPAMGLISIITLTPVPIDPIPASPPADPAPVGGGGEPPSTAPTIHPIVRIREPKVSFEPRGVPIVVIQEAIRPSNQPGKAAVAGNLSGSTSGRPGPVNHEERSPRPVLAEMRAGGFAKLPVRGSLRKSPAEPPATAKASTLPAPAPSGAAPEATPPAARTNILAAKLLRPLFPR